MAHLYVFTVGPVGLRVRKSNNWKIEITDPSDVVTTVESGTGLDLGSEAIDAFSIAQNALERIKHAAIHKRGVDFKKGSIPKAYAAYLWQLIAPYEQFGRAQGPFGSGQAGMGMGSFKMRRLNPSTPPRRNPKIGPDAYTRHTINVPNGYRGVADFYNSTRFVYVQDLLGAKRESEVVTRNDAKQIIDLCRARGIHYEMYNADLGPPGLKIPIPARRTRLQQFTTKVNYIIVGRD